MQEEVRFEKSKIQKPQSAERFMKLVWRIHEVAKRQRFTIMKLRYATCQVKSIEKNHKPIQKTHEIDKTL